MILLMLGTQAFSFNRLINQFIEIYEDNFFNLKDKKIIVQNGNTSFTYEKFLQYKYINSKELDKLIDSCELIITHGGAGCIFTSLYKNKKVIALARLKKYNEHIDDHQIELVEKLYKEGYILGCNNLKESFSKINNFIPKKYNTHKEKYLSYLRNIIK